MKIPSRIRVWPGRRRFVRCRDCHQKILLVISADDGKTKPFAANAAPFDSIEMRGIVFELYEPSAFHRCEKRKPQPPRQRTPREQTRFW